MSYIIYPQVKEKIQKSWLSKVLKNAQHLSAGGYGYISPEDFWYHLSELAQKVPEIHTISHKIYEIIENPEKHPWKIGTWIDLQWKLFDGAKNFWSYSEGVELSCETKDLLLITWWNIREILSTEEIQNYKNYGFESMIDFIMTCESYVQENKFQWYKEWYHWTRNGIKTTIDGSIHWDFRLYQSDENRYPSISPYGNWVDFRPRKSNFVAGYHSMEVMFLSTILQYATQVWYEISLGDFLEFSEQYGNVSGNFWEMWWENTHDMVTFECATMNPIAAMWEKKFPHFIPTWPGVNFDYFIAIEKDNLLIWRDGNDICAHFSPEDIPDIIKAIIVQCAKWLWRTSKKRVLDILRYYCKEKSQT